MDAPMIRDKCGVFGIAVKPDEHSIAPVIVNALVSLQHRGQESCGVSTFDGNAIRTHRDCGRVPEVFTPGIIGRLEGNSGIGHVRYSTTGAGNVKDTQPFKFPYENPVFTLAFNGTISNFLDLREMLRKQGETFETDTDTEVIAKLIGLDKLEGSRFRQAIGKEMSRLKGAYSILMLSNTGTVYAFRDPNGFKPLSLAKLKNGYALASETCAFATFDVISVRDVMPGEIVKITHDSAESIMPSTTFPQRQCMFEYTYFARVDSVVNNHLVYKVRERLGKKLARDAPVEADMVVPVPDTGNIAAQGYSRESGIPVEYAIAMNRALGRTFIMPGQSQRTESVRLKLNPIDDIIRGKRIVLIDDSIVRGTTSKNIIAEMRNAGALEIHARICTPMIKSSCYFGIDFPTRKELIGSSRSVEKIRNYIDADSLYFNSIDALAESIGESQENLCLSCLTGKYPDLSAKELLTLEDSLSDHQTKAE
ncbi:MAG: amidophosphoribosyltransferase [Candidatus Ranarchaeia archaeon]|jgi:amidophosphoribosyltransferase